MINLSLTAFTLKLGEYATEMQNKGDVGYNPTE